ncbi:MAG: homoserine O-acetyltransferase [Planctomycetota bacterium]
MNQHPAALLHAEDAPLELEFGEVLPSVEIAYETWGTLAPGRDNAIFILPAFSAHCHAASSAADPRPGWWEHMVGPGCALDTDRFFVVCASLLGGCHGTTGPRSLVPGTDRPYRGSFPVVTIRDMVATHLRLADALGIERIHAAVGSSMGAMQALEMAVIAPDRIARIAAISGTAYTRPATAAIRHLGRKAIMADPAWRNGDYEDAGPLDGLRLARELGTVFYRSSEEFNERFDHAPIRRPDLRGVTFDVQSYLDHQGRKATTAFDANSYLLMSMAMDLHDLARGRGSLEEALTAVRARCLVGGVPEDRLIPLSEQEQIRRALEEVGARHAWFSVSSPVGHDAFLVETEPFTRALKPFLERA